MDIVFVKALFILLAAVAALSGLTAFLVIRRVKRQLLEMEEVLADVKNGNGNRRVLSAKHELTASLAYEMNEIVIAYENKLGACRRMEETNRRLMTSLSHDVRTPLTTLIGYLDAVHKRAVTGEERDNYIGIARRKAYDLKEYIDELFDWFKLNSNEFEAKLRTVEAGELTRNALIDWIPVLEERRIDYLVEIPERPFWIRLNEDGYLRILNNLIQNIVTHSQGSQMKLSLSEREGKVKILVADDGVGIGKEDLDHIFERLYKCDKGRSGKGSGLGLAIARQLTEKMNGSITVVSKPGEGTAFTLLFPLTGV